jgi:hypothetical protein
MAFQIDIKVQDMFKREILETQNTLQGVVHHQDYGLNASADFKAKLCMSSSVIWAGACCICGIQPHNRHHISTRKAFCPGSNSTLQQ